MAAPSTPLELSDDQRDALSKEYFAYCHAREPDAFHCFCGSDEDLVRAVEKIRAERERADDDEIGG